MISLLRKGLFIGFATVIFSGCTAETPPINIPPSPTPVIKMPADDTVPRARISLGSALFSGKILFDATKVMDTEDTFTIPVFLKKVGSNDNLDTISVKFALPKNTVLSRVLTPPGFSADIEGISSQNPVVYFHGNEGEEVPKIISTDAPIFSLVFKGSPAGNIGVRAGFFFRNATLKQTNRAVLNLNP